MGKLKKKDNAVNRIRNILLEKSLSHGDGLLQNTPIETIMQTLEDHKQREQAAVQLANYQMDPESQQQLNSIGLYEQVARLLPRSTETCRLYLVGALKNFSDGRSPEVCDAMVSQGVVAAICSILDDYKQPWSPTMASIHISTTFTKSTYDSKTLLLRETLALLCNLCEANSQALELFNKSSALPVLLAHLQEPYHASKVASVVARCLYSLSENNPTVDQVLRESAHSELLYNLASTDGFPSLLRAASAGTLLNAYSCKNSLPQSEDITRAMAKVALSVLNTKLGECLQTFAQNFASLKTSEEQSNEAQNKMEEEEQRMEDMSEELLDLIAAVQISLEILTNLGLNLESKEEEEEWMDEDMEDDEEVTEESSVDPASHVEDTQGDSVATLLSIPIDQLLDTVLTYGHSLTPEVTSALDAYPPLLDNVHQLQVSALQCLPNLLHGVPQLPASQQDGWFSLVNSALHESRPDMLTALTSAIHAMFPALVKSPGLLERISDQDLELLYKLAAQTSEEEVQINIVSTVGILGQSLSDPWRSNSQTVVLSIGKFLLQAAQASTSLPLAAESLNAIIDVFSSDDTDAVARELGLVSALEPICITFRKMAKKKRRDPHSSLITTVKDNLPQFIQYKKHRLL